MTAIAANGRRDTKRKGDALGPDIINMAVTATKQIKPGGLVCMVAGGTAEPGKTGTGLVALGVSEDLFDNTLSLSPAPVARIRTGRFALENSAGGDQITAAHRGHTVYMVDDQTVALTDGGGTRSPAGTCDGLDDDGKPIVAISPLLPFNASGGPYAMQVKTLELIGPGSTAAGQGVGADTNGTARTYNLDSALPAGARLQGYMVHRVAAFVGNTTLSATIGSTGAVAEIASAIDLMGAPGYTLGTPGAKERLVPTAAQLLLTLTPDGGSKVSQATVGDVKVTVFYTDATA